MCSYIPLLFQTFDDMSLTDFFTTLTVLHLSVAVRPKDTLTFGDLKKIDLNCKEFSYQDFNILDDVSLLI